MTFRFKKAFYNRLSVQIFTVFTVLIFSISFAFSALMFYQQKKALILELEENGKLLIKTLAHSCRIGVFSENKDLLLTPVAGVFQHESVLDVGVFNTKGEAILQKAARGQADQADATLPESLRDIGHPSPLSAIVIEDRKEKVIFWSPVMPASDFKVAATFLGGEEGEDEKDRPLGFLRLTLGKSSMERQLAVVLLRNVIIAACFLVIGTLVTYVIARRITQPLKRLTEAAIASGEAGMLHPFPVESRNEIGNLAVAFNNLSVALDKRNAEKHLLEDKLWQSQKMEAIGTLAGGIAHDFNNIIGIIMGFSEMALLTAPPEGKYRDYLQEVFKASGRAKDLVNQILTFSRKDKTEGRPMHIGLVIKEGLKMLRASLPSTIEIRQTIQRDLPPVMADPTQIYQVLMNLCTNAAHAMSEKGGVLEVGLVRSAFDSQETVTHPDLKPGKYQKLTVRDNGHGMDRSVLDRIFEPFYTTKKPGEGTGMGLAVVHGIVKTHAGATLVQSEPGRGTCFEIFFPELERVVLCTPEAEVPVPTGNERILLVDDEEPLVRAGEQFLASFGYRVTTAINGLDALRVFKAAPHQFDLVITDLTMPKMTGLDLSSQLLELRADIPIILCTGFSEAIRSETAKTLGIRELAFKPIVWKDLARIIRRSLT